MHEEQSEVQNPQRRRIFAWLNPFRERNNHSFEPRHTEESLSLYNKLQRFLERRKSRRYAIKAGAAAVAGAMSGAKLYTDHQNTFDKASRSLREGKIIEDIVQVVESQVPKSEQMSLGKEVPYDAEWLQGYFESMSFFQTQETERGRVAFLEITNKGKILIKRLVGDVEISQAFGQVVPDFVTLPYPQNDVNNNYLMYAAFNTDGITIIPSSASRSKERGGLLFEDGKIRVGYPGDLDENGEISPYTQFDISRQNSAIIEYFFVLDSRRVAQDLDELSTIPSDVGKNYRNTQEFSTAIVTFFSEDKKGFKTFVLTSFRELKESREFDPPLLPDFTIPQLVSLAQDFLDKKMLGYDRFFIAFADPGPNQYLAESVGVTHQDLVDQKKDMFEAPQIPKDVLQQSILHRTLGGSAASSSVYRPVKALKPAYLVVEKK